MEIKSIADCLEHLNTVVQWHEKEWGTVWAEEVRQATHLNAIPTMYVALDDNKPVGTSVLSHKDMLTRLDLTPWLAGIFVKPEYRNRGIASRLAQYAMEQAARMGVRRLWLYTPNSRSLYERLGWVFVEEQEYLGERVSIMRLDLPGTTR